MNKDWIRENLLDKNGNPNRQKKKSKITPEIIEHLESSVGNNAHDLNGLIFAYLHDITKPECDGCGCPVPVNKHGAKKGYCTLTCMNANQGAKLSDSMKKAWSDKGDSILAKRKATNLEKYGVEHVLQIKGKAQEVADKSKEAKAAGMAARRKKQLEQYGLLDQQIQAGWTVETKKMVEDDSLLRELHVGKELNIYEIAEHIGCKPATIKNRLSDMGIYRQPLGNTSSGQYEIYKFVSELIGEDNIVLNDRMTFGNKLELDIWIPSLNIAIEYNGVYWHSLTAETLDKKNYHYDKFKACRDAGIKLIQIGELEWKHKKDICKSIIMNALGLCPNRIFARATITREISSKEAREFLEGNHINGYARSKRKYGLFDHKDTLVAVMTFGDSRYNKNIDGEIIRFATLQGYSIVGGASKLFKAGTQHYDSIMTYADYLYGDGSVYEKIGMKPSGETKPGYAWYYNRKMIPRGLTMKHKLPDLLGDSYDENLSEDLNMFKAGARKLYDAGNARFVWYK